MTERLKKICDEIRDLEPDERLHVRSLLDELGETADPEFERVWLAEAERRSRTLLAEAAAATAVTSEEDAEEARERVARMMKRRS